MKRQSAELPIKAEMEFINKKGFPHKKPQLVKTNSLVNKGKDKDWYLARAKKNLTNLSWS